MKNQPDHNYLGDMMNTFPSAAVTTELIQKMLDENKKLILAILDNQSLGRLQECATYQERLQNNLMYLAAIADAQSARSLPISSNLPGRTNPMLQPSQSQNHPQHQQIADHLHQQRNHLQQQQRANHLQQQQIADHLLQQQIADHLQQQQIQLQQQQMLNQSILGKELSTHSLMSSLQPLHGVTQQHQQFLFHASPPPVFNSNALFNMLPGSDMGMPSLNSCGSLQDISNGFTSSLTVQGNMVLDQVMSGHGDPNTAREVGSGSGQGAHDFDTYLTLPEDGN